MSPKTTSRDFRLWILAILMTAGAALALPARAEGPSIDPNGLQATASEGPSIDPNG